MTLIAHDPVSLNDHRIPGHLVAALVDAVRRDDPAGRAEAASAIAAELEAFGLAVDPLALIQEARTFAATVEAYAQSDGVQLVRGDAVRIEPVRWLWPGWIARGKLHLLAGAPGTGKTTIALALGAVTTRKGAQFPDGSVNAEAGDVLIWSGEDDRADTLAPRLRAMGADMSRVHFVDDVVVAGGQRRPFDPARDMPTLLDAAAKLRPAFTLIDPVVLAIGGDSHKNAETRRGLQPICELSAALKCATVGITHLTKNSSGRDPVDRIIGSVAFGAVARIVLAAAIRSDEQGGGRILVRAKSNIGPDGGGFVYALEKFHVDSVETTRIKWSDTLSGGARDLLATAESQAESGTLTGDAADFLRSALARGATCAADVLRDGEAAGFSRRTVQRAADDLRVRRGRSGFGPGSKVMWSLSIDANSSHAEKLAPMASMGTPHQQLSKHTHIDAIDASDSRGEYVAPMDDGGVPL